MFKFYSLLFLACFLLSIPTNAQSVLNPADTIVEYNASNPPTQPTFGQIGKWVRTKSSFTWNTNEYKAYIYKGCAFRLHYPKTYNPTANDGKKYPVIIMFHGLGEAGPITDNENQLYHAGAIEEAAIDNGTFDGYAIFMQSQGFWGTGQYQYLTEIINYMILNNKVDPFKIYVHGLSAGGQGAWEMLLYHPTYVACDLPMSNVSIGYKDTSIINQVKFTPMWNFQGGLDGAPSPNTAEQVRDAMVAAGANYKYTEYSDLGHDTWDRAYSETDFFPFMLRSYPSNPWTLYGRTAFCPTDTINVTLGVARGFNKYQWRRDSVIIPGDTTNTIHVTTAGTYDVRVLRDTFWSDWSHTPVQITIKTATVTPPISVAGAMSCVIPAADSKNYVNLQVPDNGYVSYTWENAANDSVVGNQRILKVNKPGNYIVTVTEQYGCSSIFSSPFTVVNANGSNTPSPATNPVATTLSFTQIELDWARNPKPAFSETGFEIYRSKTSGGPYTYVGQVPADTVTYVDNGLTPNVKYYYKIRAVNGSAAAALSNEVSATTQSDKTPPTAPANLRLTYSSRTSLSLAWDSATDNAAVTEYDIYINGVKTYVTNQTSFIVGGLQPLKQYAIYVIAKDASNNYSVRSNQLSAATILRGLHYKYYQGSWTTLPDFNKLTPVSQGISANTDITIAPATTQFGFLWEGYIIIPVDGTYKFETYSDDGSMLWLNNYNASITPLANNDGVHGVAYKGGTITLKAGVYPISVAYFQQTSSKAMQLYWTCSNLFKDNNRHLIDNKYFSDSYTPAGTAPTPPTNIITSATAYNAVNISWTKTSSNQTGYEIYRTSNPSAPYSIVGTTNASATSFTDSNVSGATTYYYLVQAINNYGASGFDFMSSPELEYAYYEGSWSSLPNFATLTPIKTGYLPNVSLSVANATQHYALEFSGLINIPTTGTYTFYTNSDDGSQLTIGSTLVVNNNNIHAAKEVSGNINLTKGTYPIFITYFQYASGAALTASYKGPGIAKQPIPDSILRNKLAVVTTPALPDPPCKPKKLTVTAISPSVINLGWDTGKRAISYQIYRSIGDSTNFRLLNTVTASTDSVTYVDSSLFGNVRYYYKVRSTGVGGYSIFTHVHCAKTKDNNPVITKLPARTNAHFGLLTSIPISATDADGDSLTFKIKNMPLFATFTDNGDQTATLNILSTAILGLYNNISICVKDHNGGKDSTTFNLNVTNHNDPTIDSVANYTMNENDTLSIPLTAHEFGSTDSMSWTITNLPNNYTITPVSNGKSTLFLHPTFAAAGVYNVQLAVTDTDGGYATRQFTVTVNDKNPNTMVYVRFKDADNIGAPWNNVTGLTSNNFVDASNNTTNIGLALQTTWWATYNAGATTGNNSGVYPDAVLQDYYYFGIFGGPNTVSAKVTGLDTSKTYNLTFFAGSAWTGATDNGTTSYTIGSQTLPLYVQNNTQNTVTFYALKPASDSTITFSMTKATPSTPVGYLSAMVISSIYDDGTTPLAPNTLNAQNVPGQGVQLSWHDIAYNETGYQVYRGLSATGTFQLVASLLPNSTNYLDTGLSGNVEYFYKVNAINSHGASNYSNLDSITTTDRIPQINSISDILLKNNQQTTVNVYATDDTTDRLTLTASNLPSFATFTDNGNGSGTISIIPTLTSIGYYPNITITATDLSDSSRSASFNLSVVDKNIASVYLNFSDGSLAGNPWNNLAAWPFAGTTFTNLYDDSHNVSGITVNLKNGFQGIVASGMHPNNGASVYPDVVLRTAEYEGTTNKDTIVVSGLLATKKYNFVFFNSHNDGLVGLTNFTMNGQTVSLNASYNINKTVQINGITPDATGSVTIVVAKGTNADYAFISSLVIQSYDSSLGVISPADLRVINTQRTSVTLQWQDRSYNETGFEVWRATDSSGSYSLLNTLGANVTTYKDSNLNGNTTYYYTIRAKNGTSYSNYSNYVAATTYAYSVYVNFTTSNEAGIPWNNTNAVPENGNVWNNFLDETDVPSSVGMQVTNDWAGMYTAGMVVTNNSGVYPDTVLIDSYGLFPGQAGDLQINGLSLAMNYDLTFFASSQAYGDVTSGYIVNNDTSFLDASLNTYGTTTMYGNTSDANGNLNITVIPASITSQFGLIGSLIIQGYTPDLNPAPHMPASMGTASSKKLIAANNENNVINNSDNNISVYPNPFNDHFVISVQGNNNDKAQVTVTDISGRTVYQDEYKLNNGNNNLTIKANSNLEAGVYIVKVSLSNTHTTKVIKLVKQQ